MKKDNISKTSCDRQRIWYWFGLDVSKSSFTAACYNGLNDVVAVPPKGFAMTSDGVEQFMKWIRTMMGVMTDYGIVMESTGIYSINLGTLLLSSEPNMHISICNPRSVSFYIRCHTPNKTDRTDAVYIARYGFDTQPPKQTVSCSVIRRLREAVDERYRLVRIRTLLGNASESITASEVDSINKKVLDELDRQIAALEELMLKIVAEDLSVKREIDLMDTAPGVGFLSAASIYAYLGSLAQYTRKGLSAMSGVCPANGQSGTSLDGSHLSKRGPKRLRQILYLDSATAISKIPALSALKGRLLAKDTSCPMMIRCACMRKLLLILRGMVVSGKEYDKDFVSKDLKEEKNNKTTEKTGQIMVKGEKTENNAEKSAQRA